MSNQHVVHLKLTQCYMSIISQFKKLYNTVLSTIVTMLYIRYSDFIHLIAESLYPFTNLIHGFFSTVNTVLHDLRLGLVESADAELWIWRAHYGT